jgi:hypothetical protein
MKIFTLDEAQSLLPVVESLLKRAMDTKNAAEEIEQELQQLARRIHFAGGYWVDAPKVFRRRAELQKQLEQVKEVLEEIDSIGVQVKDLNSGLLDFPCRLEDEIVLLCWKMGESSIGYWHTQDSGYAGRQPIDERFHRRIRPN